MIAAWAEAGGPVSIRVGENSWIGARAVLLGRPVQWGLAAGGEAGIVRMLELIAGEFQSAMGLCGAATVGKIERAMITRNPDPAAGRV